MIASHVSFALRICAAACIIMALIVPGPVRAQTIIVPSDLQHACKNSHRRMNHDAGCQERLPNVPGVLIVSAQYITDEMKRTVEALVMKSKAETIIVPTDLAHLCQSSDRARLEWGCAERIVRDAKILIISPALATPEVLKIIEGRRRARLQPMG